MVELREYPHIANLNAQKGQYSDFQFMAQLTSILNGWDVMRGKASLDSGGEILKRKRFLGKWKVVHKKLQHYHITSTKNKLKHNFQSIPSGFCAQLRPFKSKTAAIPLHIWKTTISIGIYSNAFIFEGGKSCIFICCTCR